MSGDDGVIYTGEVAEHGSDDWTVVVTDADRDYVVRSLHWQGYSLLRHRVLPVAATGTAS